MYEYLSNSRALPTQKRETLSLNKIQHIIVHNYGHIIKTICFMTTQQ